MKVFHPNIHIVSNYMDFDKDVSQISFGLGMGKGWGPPQGHFTLNINPNLGRGRRGRHAGCVVLWKYLFTYGS